MKQLKNRILCLFLVFTLMNSCFNVLAADKIGYNLTMSSETVQIGETVEVIVGITNYTENVSGIRGIQIDIEEINSDILSVVRYESLIEDSSAFLNDATYNDSKQFARYLYMHRSVALDTSYGNIYRIVFQVNESLKEAGSITLPISIKFATWDEEITFTSEITINYTAQDTGGDDETEVTSVDITWGSLTYEYVKDEWNEKTHTYNTEGWTDNDTGYVVVKNSGKTSEMISINYSTDRNDISGIFTDGSNEVNSAFEMNSGEEKTLYLELSGEPEENLENRTIGEVTVTIGGE